VQSGPTGTVDLTITGELKSHSDAVRASGDHPEMVEQTACLLSELVHGWVS
jgi:hypothetical protein